MIAALLQIYFPTVSKTIRKWCICLSWLILIFLHLCSQLVSDIPGVMDDIPVNSPIDSLAPHNIDSTVSNSRDLVQSIQVNSDLNPLQHQRLKSTVYVLKYRFTIVYFSCRLW